MRQEQSQQQSPMPQQPMQQGGGDEQATDEEQQALEQAFDIALEMIHGDGQAGDQIASMVQNSQDIVQGIGQAVATVLIGVEKKAGGLADDMKIQLATEIAGELTELAVNAGALSEDEVNDAFIQEMIQAAYAAYIEFKESMGELDPQELEASVADAEQVMGGSVRNQAQGQAMPQQQQPQGRGLLGV